MTLPAFWNDAWTAIQQQMGLKLDSTIAAVDRIVIDHVEKPVNKDQFGVRN